MKARVTPIARGRVRRHGISNENEINVPSARRSGYSNSCTNRTSHVHQNTKCITIEGTPKKTKESFV